MAEFFRDVLTAFVGVGCIDDRGLGDDLGDCTGGAEGEEGEILESRRLLIIVSVAISAVVTTPDALGEPIEAGFVLASDRDTKDGTVGTGISSVSSISTCSPD